MNRIPQIHTCKTLEQFIDGLSLKALAAIGFGEIPADASDSQKELWAHLRQFDDIRDWASDRHLEVEAAKIELSDMRGWHDDTSSLSEPWWAQP